MAKLDDLVPDIYEMLLEVSTRQGSATIDDEDLKGMADGIADAVRRSLTLRDKADRTIDDKMLYVSEVGKPCLRQLWYAQRPDTPQETLMPHAKVKFLFGDILEELMLFLAKTAGHEVKDEQREVEIELRNGWKLRGRIDAIIDNVVTDVKSASTFGFKKFKENTLHTDDPFGYMAQIYNYNIGLETPDGNDMAFFAIDKQHGHMTITKYRFSQAEKEAYLDHMQQLTDILEEDVEPARGFDPVPEGKSGNMKLPMQCSYCKYKHHCYRDANDGKGLRTFVSSRGPLFLTTVKREPRMTEVK